ncbi:RNA polymerase II subunit B1 CTD phosphatase Rpap2 [Eumeta japonica]|uniref:RNA polymerase II subunit B1 CTD phosphatase Rpap2 n=1 Tax=Eumeta variegata TaxID=151549 RepID=A0A4C1T1Y7_EUMVA|nr:RNA polymerase II subunit B1 CTD phosphatase Rpap2 [Eumeta japonica]
MDGLSKLKRKPPKIQDMTKEQIKHAIQKKRECNAKAQGIVESLIETEYEEIPNFCLLPLDTAGSLGQEIDVSLTEKLGVQIEKKSFTTVNDFARMQLQKMHQDEREQYENKTNNNTKVNQISSKAESISVETDISQTTKGFVNTNELKNICVDGNLDIAQQLNCEKSEMVGENNEKPIKMEKNIMHNLEKPIKMKKNVGKTNPLNIVGEIIEKPEEKIDVYSTNVLNQNKEFPLKGSPTNKKDLTIIKNQQKSKKELSISIITTQVEMALAEWLSLDSVFFLLGEERVKELVIDKTDIVKCYIDNYANSIFYHSNTYDQYQQLCRRLNILELEDKKFDSGTLQQKTTKPLPDYALLKEESKTMNLKVKAFLAGETEIPIDKSIEVQKHEANDEPNLRYLPLVDKNAQNALRRRIVYQHLNKVLPDLLGSLGLLTLNISSDVRLLVNTFKLKANNIIFKPIQWTLITIVMIKLLSLRNPQLEFLLRQQVAYQHLQLLLLSYKKDGGYLDSLVRWLIDINRILEVNDGEQTNK